MEKLLNGVAVTLVLAVLGAWLYYRYLYQGGRRRKPGAHRYNENCVTMMWATVRPSDDKDTWFQVAIGGYAPLEAGVL